MVKIYKSSQEDAKLLTEISKESFNHDARLFLDKELGPYGYDSLEWHLKKMAETDYYKITSNNVIAGGVYVLPVSDNHYQLECIYIHPDFQNQGVGATVMTLIENTYPNVTKWTLDTPSWNPRTNRFYEKLGYIKIGEEDLKFLVLNLYEKKI